MKNVLLIIAGLFFIKVHAQVVDRFTDPHFGSISPEIELKIKEKVEQEILWYRAALCPEVDFEQFVKRGYENGIILYQRDPKAIFLKDSLTKGKVANEYKMVLEVTRWPEGNPYPNFYLVKKSGLKFTNGTDTLSFDICNDYFKYDELFVVKGWEIGIPKMISGNVFKDRLYPSLSNDSINSEIAWNITNFRLGQFDASFSSSFPGYGSHETAEYFQFKVDKSLLSPKSVLVRVPKSDPFNTIEVLYYTNDTTITKGDIYGLYEVKYTLQAKPESYEQTLPVITKTTRAFLNDKIKNENKEWQDVAHLINLPPIIEEKEIEIKGKIDTVYFKEGEPLIIIIDEKGIKTELVNEEAVRYLIKGKGKLQVVVTENGEILYKKEED